MLVRRKYQLPTMWKFQTKKFDIERLRDEAIELANDYGNVMETNKALCSNNCDLVESVYKHFKQAKGHNHRTPLLCVKKNREPALAIITLDHFFELIERDD